MNWLDKYVETLLDCDGDRFKELYQGEWRPSDREIELEKRLNQYYVDSDLLCNREAHKLWTKFINWARGSGYIQPEIQQAKKMASLHHR